MLTKGRITLTQLGQGLMMMMTKNFMTLRNSLMDNCGTTTNEVFDFFLFHVSSQCPDEAAEIKLLSFTITPKRGSSAFWGKK